MNFFLNFKKNYFFLLIIIFTLFGVYLSLNVGITHDENFDLDIWQANKNLLANFFTGQNLNTDYLNGGGKHYGIGFHLLSYPIEFLIKPLLAEFNYINETQILLSKHASVFIFFIISGIIFRKIILSLISSNLYANLATFNYLLYPYLLGHSFFNIKDIPFLSVWMVCTYYLIRMIQIFLKKKIILRKHIFLISLFSAYLISIRVSGILIFVQYLIFAIFLVNMLKLNIIDFLKDFYKEIVSIIFLIIFFSILFRPSIWSNPTLLFEGIILMSQYIQTVCTITLGECMKAQNLPASYLPIWFFFKLPIIILIGLALYPIVEKNLNSNKFNYLVINCFILTIFSIIFLMIIFNVNLYDEIRHIMFLMPLIFIVSFTLMYFFSKRFFKILGVTTLLFFTIQNIKIYPYNYIWINNFSHLTKINGLFELDYWGVSTKAVANFFNDKKLDKEICIITNRNIGVKALLNNSDQCFLPFKNLHTKNQRPFYVAMIERGVKKGPPYNCKPVFEEISNLNFSKERLVLAKIYKCT